MSEAPRALVLINVFTVAAKNQLRLVEILTRATQDVVSAAPGFLSATLHRSTDGTKVTMLSNWRSVAEYEAMRRAPAPLPYFQEALEIATFSPGAYEVVGRFSPNASAISA